MTTPADDLDRRIAALRAAVYRRHDNPHRCEPFGGIRFTCLAGCDWRCEVWYGGLLSAAGTGPTVREALAVVEARLADRGRPVGITEEAAMDAGFGERREALYARWAAAYPGEPFNLIVAMERGLLAAGP